MRQAKAEAKAEAKAAEAAAEAEAALASLSQQASGAVTAAARVAALEAAEAAEASRAAHVERLQEEAAAARKECEESWQPRVPLAGVRRTSAICMIPTTGRRRTLAGILPYSTIIKAWRLALG